MRGMLWYMGVSGHDRAVMLWFGPPPGPGGGGVDGGVT